MKSLKELLQTVSDIFAQENFIREPRQLYEPIDYTLRLGGKRIRPVMLLAANQLFGGDEQQVHDAAIGIETFHNFTLLHDDLMDKSPLRRGKPTVYCKWDENTAILSGDAMYTLAWQYLLRQPHPRLQTILNSYNDTAIGVMEGQQWDMNYETRDDVTISEYLEMIRLKTAVLLAGALKLGALYANAPEADIQRLYSFGIHIGLAFQLQDDLLDAYGDVAVFGKQTCQDIRDHKKTYLILKALECCPDAQRATLREAFASADIPQVLDIYSQLNIRQQVEEAIQKEFALAQDDLQSIQADDARKQPLRDLMTMLLGRDK